MAREADLWFSWAARATSVKSGRPRAVELLTTKGKWSGEGVGGERERAESAFFRVGFLAVAALLSARGNCHHPRRGGPTA